MQNVGACLQAIPRVKSPASRLLHRSPDGVILASKAGGGHLTKSGPRASVAIFAYSRLRPKRRPGFGQKMRTPGQEMRSKKCGRDRRCGPTQNSHGPPADYPLPRPAGGRRAGGAVRGESAPEGFEDEMGFHIFATSAGEEIHLDLVAESDPQDSGGLLHGGGRRSGSRADA